MQIVCVDFSVSSLFISVFISNTFAIKETTRLSFGKQRAMSRLRFFVVVPFSFFVLLYANERVHENNANLKWSLSVYKGTAAQSLPSPVIMICNPTG